MSKINHLIVHTGTDMRALESTLGQHGDTISYIKIASAHSNKVPVKEICSLVRGSAISVCIGGGLAEQEAGKHYTKIGKIFGEDTRDFRNLMSKGVDAIELPAEVLDNAELVTRSRDFFQKILVEVGVKSRCFHNLNDVSCMQEGIQRAEEFGADHIVLEGSAGGDCGIYQDDTFPNILVVHELMMAFSDKTKCIIEAPIYRQQDIWRVLFGAETHIGNIYHFNNINAPVMLRIPDGYWHTIGLFIQRLRSLSDSLGLSWDDVSRMRELNVDTINDFPRISSFSDTELEAYLKRITFGPKDVKEFITFLFEGFNRWV